MFNVVDNQIILNERLKEVYTYEDFKEGSIHISRGDFEDAMRVIHDIFGVMISVDTNEIFIYDNEKGYYKEVSPDQFTGLYEKLTNEHTTTQTSDIFKRKIFRWFGQKYTMRKSRIIEKFNKTSKNYICFKNGVFDIKEEKFLPHSKDYYFRNRINANYKENASSPVFDNFMKEFTSYRSDVERTLLEFSSYCFLSGYHYGHHFLVLNGPGRNGKSTFVRLISGILGKGTTSTVRMDALHGFDLDSIAGKLLNHSEESSGKWTDGEALANLKAITGGDTISIRAKFKKTYDESNLPKLMFAMNSLPRFGETTLALRKRLICVNCNMSLSGKEDSSIEDRMFAERDAIASKLMKHLINVKKNKGVTIYDNNDAMVKEVEKESSVYVRYFYDRINFVHGGLLWQDDIWEDFKKYADSEDYDNHISKLSLAKSLNQLLEAYQIRKKRNNGKMRTIYKDIEFHPMGDSGHDFED